MSFEQDILKYIPNISRFANKLLKSKEIDDLVQDTLLRALEKRHLYKEGNLCSWLMTIMYGCYITNIRSSARMFKRMEFVEEYPHDIGVNGNQEISVIITDLAKSFKSLSKEGREIIVHYINADRVLDIPEKLNIPLGTVKSRLSRTQKILKNKLEGKYNANRNKSNSQLST